MALDAPQRRRWRLSFRLGNAPVSASVSGSGAGCVTVEGADDEEAAGCCGSGMGAATFAGRRWTSDTAGRRSSSRRRPHRIRLAKRLRQLAALETRPVLEERRQLHIGVHRVLQHRQGRHHLRRLGGASHRAGKRLERMLKRSGNVEPRSLRHRRLRRLVPTHTSVIHNKRRVTIA